MTEDRRRKQVGFSAARNGAITIVLLLMFVVVVNVAYAARAVNWFNFGDTSTEPDSGGPSAITVAPSEDIDVKVNVTTTGSGTANDWECTQFVFTPQAGSPVTRSSGAPNYTIGENTYTQNHTIAAPPIEGTYNLSVTAWNGGGNGGCSGTGSDPLAFNSVVIVEDPYAPDPNPDLLPACALDVILVLDESNSISNQGLTTNIRNAMRDVVDAMEGTGSYLNVIEFGTRARFANIGGNTGWQLVNATYNSNAGFENYIDGGGNNESPLSFNPGPSNDADGGTNWDEAFQLANTVPPRVAGKPPLVIFVTDGLPTYYTVGDTMGGTLGGNGSSFTQQGLNEAVEWANEIKAENSHIFVAGFGDISGNLGAIQAVSGPDVYTSGNFSTADYMAVTSANIGDLGDAIAASIADLCAGSLTVTKYVEGQPTSGWTFTATVEVTQAGQNANNYVWNNPAPTGHASSIGTTKSDTTEAGGIAQWEWTPGPVGVPQPWSSKATFYETVQPGFQLDYVECTIVDPDGNFNVGPFLTMPVTVNLANDQSALCSVYNIEAEILVDKIGPTAVQAPGVPFNYTINYSNVGDLPLTNVTLKDFLPDVAPATMKLVSVVSPAGVNCAPLGTYGAEVTCTGLAPLSVGGTGQVVLQVEVNAASALQQTIINEACVIGQYAPPNLTVSGCDSVVTTTPVTLSSFTSAATAGGTRFEWTTTTEASNAGFNLYIQTDTGLEKINDELIPTQVINSQEPQHYSYEAASVSGENYFIEDISMFGESRYHGPFAAGQTVGEDVAPEAIDWAAIAAENEAAAAQSMSASASMSAQATKPSVVPQVIELRVSSDGIYRLTYEQILSMTGVDLKGVRRGSVALTNRGEPVPVFVSKNKIGEGAYIEFIGEGLDTLYTDTNVYHLEINTGSGNNRAMAILRPRPTAKMLSAELPTYYMETATVESNGIYSYLSTSGDPWYMVDLLATPTNSKTTTRSLQIDNYVPGTAPATLNLTAWGVSNLVPGPDHHLVISLNGTQVADELFDDRELVNISVPANGLQDGANTLTLFQPLDRGAGYDLTALESFGVVYPRAFVARDGRLTFEARGAAFRVTNLTSQDITVYRQSANGDMVKLTGLKILPEAGGTWNVAFRGDNSSTATYYVASITSLLTPQVAMARENADLLSEYADLLVIAHPNFIAGLAPWVQARQAQGYIVKVVDVRDVYDVYNHGIFDAEAIARYTRYAVRNMGTKFIVLVGGDTTDYRNYTGLGSISFIPSLYAPTIDGVNFAPVDPLYTDINGDNQPDAAIGRFPVRTAAELTLMVDKTLLYDQRTNVQTAVFAADAGFERDSDVFAESLPGWALEKAYVRVLGVSATRPTLVAALNSGPRLASFVGHSGRNHWSFAPMLLTADVANLTNVNAPMVVTQWGCWNTYYVDPAFNTMGHKFLLSGMNGAAVVMGSSTLTSNASERALGDLMMPRLMSPGTPAGTAMQAAKETLARSRPDMVDVLLGWTILGDPTVIVRH